MLNNAISQSICILLLLAHVSTSFGLRNRTHYHPPKETTDLSGDVKRKICIGTNGRMSVPSNREHHYRNLRDRYTNCTFVDGNLELTWLRDKDLDLSFLQYIREVTGYVLISHVDVKRIVLPRLQIIRGRTLFKVNVRDEEFALIITFCEAFSLELPALRDILNGSVGAFNNFNLCHLNTINWKELISGPRGDFVTVYNFTAAERNCPPCDKNCSAGCWGEGPENCQKFSKVYCSPQCAPGRCYGSNPRECCSLFCAGGCTGPTQNDCLACKNFNDDGVCTQSCVPMHQYNIITLVWEVNPGGKYAYGATCVKNCPEHLLKDNGACVRSCPPEKTAVKGECVPCEGPCPKTCPGVRPLESVHSGNIEDFRNCTVIDGSLEILDQSFKGFQQVFMNYSFGQRYAKMHPDSLEVFSTLKEVTGYINIQGYHEDFTNLSYFRNLEVIGGRQLMDNFFASLYIVKTSLKSLEMRSLKKINSGAVVILENKDLCYAQSMAWDKIIKMTEHRSLLQNNKDSDKCKAEGLVCDPQCSSEGCWGKGPGQCLTCQNYQYDDICIENCEVFKGMYKAGSKICKPCHEECDSLCHGPGPENCTECKNARDGNTCVPICPITKYLSDNGFCIPCHDNCVDGCSGPNNTIGVGGCNSCQKAIINCDVTVEKCLRKDESCPDGYYFEWVGPQEQGPLKPLAGKAICRKCHPRCKKCTGYGFHEQVCQECMKFKRGEQCEDECPSDHFADEETQICVPCHVECRGCVGRDASDCIKCRNFKIFVDGETSPDNTTAFNCTTSCPPDLPHKIFPNDVSIEPYCSATSFGPLHVIEASTTPPVMIAVILLVTLSLVILSIFGFVLYKRAKANKDALKMKMALAMSGHEDILEPSDVKPNLSKLRIIKEAELRQGDKLGSGAFGKVYTGVWLRGAVKIPVAIKVLTEEMGPSKTKLFLDEAYIMASVSHPNLLRLLAVCITNEMMIITQLMPSGCLLDYVRNHYQSIGSNVLLNWITQIARGMAYLEKMRLVHRDLAARNVLVQSHNCVKITDFGLAKLLHTNEDVYKAAGGKMPIKWLALECIQHRIFTHKSDVWAFGVTIWEILTFGARPYQSIPARDVPELIENGLKLPQPSICTLDIYCIMVSCWMLEAETRPSFEQLAETFAEMAKDPGRYLVIPGDKYLKQPTESVTEEVDEIRILDPDVDDIDDMHPIYHQKHLSSSSDAFSGDQNSMNKPCSSQSWSNRTMSNPRGMRMGPMDQYSGQAINWNKDLMAYPQNSEGEEMRQYCNSFVVPSVSSSSRYCSDPMKGKEMEDSENSDQKSKMSEAQVGIIKCLPLDEDDYLMPSSQQMSGASAYMDLISDSSNNQQNPNNIEMYPKYHKFNSMKIGVDNPEYLLSSKNTLGIPCLPKTMDIMERTHSSASTTPTTPNSTVPATFIGQRPIEDESISDHEYYNDLQRELQPLRRNETTV